MRTSEGLQTKGELQVRFRRYPIFWKVSERPLCIGKLQRVRGFTEDLQKVLHLQKSLKSSPFNRRAYEDLISKGEASNVSFRLECFRRSVFRRSRIYRRISASLQSIGSFKRPPIHKPMATRSTPIDEYRKSHALRKFFKRSSVHRTPSRGLSSFLFAYKRFSLFFSALRRDLPQEDLQKMLYLQKTFWRFFVFR